MIALLSHPERPVALTALRHVMAGMNRPSIGYIASQPDPQWHYFEPVMQRYRSMGAGEVHYLELEGRYDADVAKKVLDCDVVHLSGGNTFRFLAALRHRGLLSCLRERVESGRAIVGVSAGAMVMTQSVESALLCGDRNEVALDEMSGLQLLPLLFVPHASMAISTDARALAQRVGYPVVLCDDDSALLAQGEDIVALGSPHWITATPEQP
ncbi:Type 1 glutamine amidotransferase-like domain-containing protein [Ferrimonas balearica]|uniref:Type 1 glutamine amidotransferase-like domain-containing protein n=1 Tax=Ferrimonas balearica TaxID=44012 RepID=UPI001C99AA2E|nr:Type 1 glutamine amidotransferase-like domain-containing protein [Ferrimonas balearica]MBY5920207.1 Type 1 glutamine amidotransferase-like domain-containing protein [Ferrimonas balearica]MBY5997108.1 Type 1 glutamine amidotransferase-like domain-containing protein [Ferrimonas balearica]